MQSIDAFSGANRYLSNFYPSPIEWDGLTFPSVEHAYQAAKSADPNVRAAIAQQPSPGMAKRMGKSVALRPDWEEVKVPFMLAFLRMKFTFESECGRWLLNTGQAELIEGNTWGDRFWGTVNGEGRNELGKLLMQVRGEIDPR